MTRMRDAHDWLASNGRSVESGAIESVLQFRLSAAAAGYRVNLDLENIEELFSLASAATNKLARQIPSAIAGTLDYCQSVHTTPSVDVSVQHPNAHVFPSHWNGTFDGTYSRYKVPRYEYYVSSLLGTLVSGASVGENSFISFNYDMVLEEALQQLGVSFSYGFGKTTKVDRHSSNSGFVWSESAKVVLLKLHGSVNWAYPGKRGQHFTVYRSYSDVRASSLIPELVPPTWRKVFDGKFEVLWNRAVQAIETATRIIVIGFSLPATDNHFQYLLAAGLQNNQSLREFVFVNPNPAPLAERLNRLLTENARRSPRFHVVPYTIANFARSPHGVDSLSHYGRPLPLSASVSA